MLWTLLLLVLSNLYRILIACPKSCMAKAHRLYNTAVDVCICDMMYQSCSLGLKPMKKRVKENGEQVNKR